MIELFFIALIVLVPLAMAVFGIALIAGAIETIKKSLGK
jgi:hypothetical protein